MAREFFCAYHSYLNAMRKLSDAECGRLFRALLSYSAGEQLINLQAVSYTHLTLPTNSRV